jgi:hypothetical protein
LFQSPNSEAEWRKFDQTEKLRTAYRRLHGYLDASQAVIDSLQNDNLDNPNLFGDSAGAEPDHRKRGPDINETSIPEIPKVECTPGHGILTSL